MAKNEKVGSVKNLQRSARMRARNLAARPGRIKNARERHLKKARQSCGDAFAGNLKHHYSQNPNPGKKHN